MECERSLSPSEAKYKYFSLTKETREDFPPKDEVFNAKFKGKSYKLKVNNKECIMISELYHKYHFAEGDTVKFSKNKDGTFEVTVQ